MRAILDYGGFVKEIEVVTVDETIYTIKPFEALEAYETNTHVPTEVTSQRLEFRLKESPQIGKPLYYEFVRES